MRRRVLLFLIPIFLLSLLSFGIYRFLWTPDGVRWLFSTVSRYTAVSCSAEKINGRLLGRLDLEGLEIAWAKGRLRIRRLEWDLLPLHLLRGQVVFRQFTGRQIHFEDNSRKTEPLNLTLPKIGILLQKVGLEVRSLVLQTITIQRPGEPPQVIKNGAGRLSFHYGFLAVNPLKVTTPQGILQGGLGVGFSSPELWLDLHWLPITKVAQWDRISIKGRFREGKKQAGLAGTIAIMGLAGFDEKGRIEADLVIAPQGLTFRKMAIRERGRQGLVSGEGTVNFDQAGPVLSASLTIDGLDLAKELGQATRLSGPVRLEGRVDNYRGHFDLKNRVQSWQAFGLTGTLEGGLKGLEVQLKQVEWLKGVLSGRIALHWDQALALSGSIKGRQLKPEVFNPQWDGLINLDAQGRFLWPAAGDKEGHLTATLLDSRFQGKALKGGIKAMLKGERVAFDHLDLQGRGFRLSGNGVLDDRFNLEARIQDLSALLPAGRGSLKAGGWARWRNGLFGGRMDLQGRELSWKGIEVGEMHLEAALDQEKPDSPISLKTRIRKPAYQSFEAQALTAGVEGTLAGQRITLAVEGDRWKVRAGLDGAFREGQWRGRLESFLGKPPDGKAFKLQSPVALQVDPERLHLSPSVFIGPGQERLVLSADLALKTMKGLTALEWQQIDLARLGPLLGETVSGQMTGKAGVTWLGPDRIQLQARADLAGDIPVKGKELKISKADVTAFWDDSGLHSSFNLETARQARLWGEASSPEKGRPALPERLTWTVHWEGLELTLLIPKKPSGLQTEGTLKGQAVGEWASRSGFRVKGGLKLDGGGLSYNDQETRIKAQIKAGEVQFNWADDRLDGHLTLELVGYGKISGQFHLPLSSHFPVVLQNSGPLALTLQGNIRERGLLSALLPEAVLSGQGRLQWNVSARGTWENPLLNGDLELVEPRAEIRPLGVQLRDILIKGTFSQDHLTLTAIKMASGKGKLNGTADFRLKDWKIVQLAGKIQGDHFQFINRPGLMALASPALEFSGRPDQLVVAGVLEIPEGLLSGGQPEGFKRASPDVRVVDRPDPSVQEKALPVQGEIRLVLGPKVRLRAEGLDGLLQGTIRVNLKGSKDIRAFGKIGIMEGNYLLQGQKLAITQGHFLFNGPPDNPGLDLLALRSIRSRQRLEEWIDEIKAGFAVTGTLQKPLIKLYSRPPLSDTDILSYILFGQPLNQGAGQKSLAILGQAAKTLLGPGVTPQMPGLLNPDTIDVQSEGSDMTRSFVTVGKYLDPRLFLGLGGSLFSNSYQVILRYALTPYLEIETKGGTNSGGGLYFKVDFE